MEADPLMQGLSKDMLGLSFDKDIFMKDDFNIDTFIMQYRKTTNLETLRSDLQLYLKILQSSMIELINKDYADFVNLSTNLVGMDKAIKNISIPLGQLKEEVLSVKMAMTDAISCVKLKLDERLHLRQKKEFLQQLVKISHSLENIEKLLKVPSYHPNSPSMSTDGKLMERVATELNKLQFYVGKSAAHPLVDKLQPRIQTVIDILQVSLEGSFLRGLEQKNVSTLCQCLRTYALIDKTSVAEELFARNVIRPYVKKLICEEEMKGSPEKLEDIFNKILEFVQRDCQIIRDITSSHHYGDHVQGYDFVVNSIWPTIVTVIDTQAGFLFAPGNPAVFHQRYKQWMDFLDKFELLCASRSSLKHFRSSTAYTTFMSRWSLPIYFQIRFQDIAGLLENILSGKQAFYSSNDGLFMLESSHVLWSCLNDCWKDEIFLPALLHRFMKLTFQLISRFAVWLDEVYRKMVSKSSTDSVSSSREPSSALSNTTSEDCSDLQRINVDVLITVVSDVQLIVDKLPSFFDVTIIHRTTEAGYTSVDTIKDAMKESCDLLSSRLTVFYKHIESEILSQCSVYLRQVNDIPRLYRRTNKEPPQKASHYVDKTMQPLNEHLEKFRGVLQDDVQHQFIVHVVRAIIEQYSTLASDVLSSVKKMEDSLKRLKKGKGAASLGAGSMSDDDKIRRQIILDVAAFTKWIVELNMEIELQSTLESLTDVSSTAKSSMI